MACKRLTGKRNYNRRKIAKTKKCLSKTKIVPKPTKYVFSSSNVIKFRTIVRTYEKFHYEFLNYNQIEEYLKKMETKFPGKMQLETIGKSVEGRNIFLVMIRERSSDNKIGTLIEAGSNGNDWLSISSALYLIDFFTRNLNLVKVSDYYIIPCSNPDAYERCLNQKPTDTSDITINLSNNFPILLGTTDMENISTEDFLKALAVWKRDITYLAPTTKAIFRAATCNQFTVKLFVSLQEEGKKIVYPFGFTNHPLPDEDALKKVAKSAQARLQKLRLEVGSIYDLCGLTYGAVIDFLKFNCDHIKFMYVVHTRYRSERRAAEDVLIYGEEILNMMKSMARNVYMFYNKDEINANGCF